MKKVKKVLSFLLVFCMILTIMPMGVYATDLEESSAAADDLISEATPTPVPAEDIPADDPVEEDPTPAPTEQPTPASAEEPASYGITPYSGEAKSVSLDTSTFYRIFHLDCGRKYFSVDQIKDLIDTLAANKYTHIELAVGNDGLRFLLDDMSVTANDTTYTSDAVKAGIQAGNKTYYDFGTNELTQMEMDTIISYANGKGIGIIPLINTPGHMDAILYACQQLCDSSAAYGSSSTTIDVTNTKAVAFTQALVQKYVNYFAGKGCKLFNLGADEYAGTSFGALQSAGSYDEYAAYVNGVAAIIKNAGMVPLAFNDGIYYNGSSYSGNSSITFDTDIVICYWTNGYPGYSPASVEYLQSKGFKNFIHTNESWYYVLDRNNNEWAGYNTAENATKTIAVDSMSIDEVGAMICVWCDTPSASYDNNATKISTLISNLATSNPTYFAANSGETDPTDPTNPGESVEVTENETITVTVGGTATATISGYNFAGTYTTEDPSIATVKVTGTDATEATTTYTQASVTCNTLISSDKRNWTAVSGYYYKADDGNYYPVYAKRSSSWKLFQGTTYTYTWGYSTTSSTSNVTQIGTQSTKNTSDAPSITVYTQTQTDAVPASTTVTFTGVTVGTTYVTVGNTRYEILVQDKAPDDAITRNTLSIEYRITNSTVYTSQNTASASSATISSSNAASDEGIAIVSAVPETAYSNYDGWIELHYWQAMRLDSEHYQSGSGSGADQTTEGITFTHVRYHNSAWQYLTSDGVWHYFQSGDQAVAYYMRHTEITTEITTAMKDWGYSTSSTTPDTSSNLGQVALTVAVVYPDGTVSPAESNMYANSTTIFNFSSNWQSSGKARDIGLIVPLNNSDYTISKITVTDGTRTDNTNSNTWTSSATIEWDKVTNEAGSEWYDENTYWDETMGGTPMINGATQDIRWSAKNTAKLVLIYLKPVHYDTNLTVKWVDDSAAGALISTMEVAVSSDGTPITFYNGLKQTSALPTEGDGGTFTLDDDAYVTNSSNVNQTFNKNISTVPGVADQYKSGLYQYVSADLSADGMTLTLHYNINSAKLSKSYVVDFGLPVNIPLSELVENADDVESVEIVSGNAKVNEDKSITYQPEAIMSGTETVRVKIIYGSDPKTIAIGFIPATTVYYEEGFATYSEGWTGGSSKGTGTQTASVAGSKALYGFDSKYANETVGPSNGTEAKCDEGSTGQTATFEFTGTGVEIYTNNTRTSGSVMASIYNAETETHVKTYIVHTAMKDGDSDATHGQNVTAYNVPIISARDLDYGQYKVVIKHVKSSASDTTIAPVSLDGFRVHGTLASDTPAYVKDLEDNPTFIELRDKVLAGLNVDNIQDSQYKVAGEIIQQVYDKNSSTEGAVVLSNNGTYSDSTAVQDLLDNGPKNELYLQKNQAVVFKVTTNRVVQIGLKALNANTTYTINNGELQTLNTSTDMFYTVVNAGAATNEQTITITNTGTGILSITLVKICDDPNAAFASLTEEDLIPALLSLGFEDKATSTPEPTAEPTIEPTATPEPTAEPTPVVTPTPAPTNPPKPVVPNNPIQDFFNAVRNILNKWFGW